MSTANVREKIAKLNCDRLAEECAKLDPAEEQALAEEGWDSEAWPAY